MKTILVTAALSIAFAACGGTQSTDAGPIGGNYFGIANFASVDSADACRHGTITLDGNGGGSFAFCQRCRRASDPEPFDGGTVDGCSNLKGTVSYTVSPTSADNTETVRLTLAAPGGPLTFDLTRYQAWIQSPSGTKGDTVGVFRCQNDDCTALEKMEQSGQ